MTGAANTIFSLTDEVVITKSTDSAVWEVIGSSSRDGKKVYLLEHPKFLSRWVCGDEIQAATQDQINRHRKAYP